ncbi:cation-translocating P-type ATPase [Desulfovibrio cuneatus]|uniref:cation-translocating P-type ATPase n=1 Tax=Desulfovibrio cuneatus TaxID=159728 RepID=UPI0004171979|nr:HAD-IC family P-type ATPase [Desulfovibrio cuneatus]
MNSPAPQPWHSLLSANVIMHMHSDVAAGLSPEEAAKRLALHGKNLLPEGNKPSSLMRFGAQFQSILVYVLLAAGCGKLLLGMWLDAGIIFAVVFLNALLGFIQEGRAEKSLATLRTMLSAEARVKRGGKTRMIPAQDLVPGDIVLLESGHKVPADLRLIHATNLRTEEAALTGESVPSEKSADPVPEQATVGDQHCMAFSGTMVVYGRGTGVVVATGSGTELGKINQMLTSVSLLETPLLRQIKKLSYLITGVVAVVAALVFGYGFWIMDMPFTSLFQAVVGIAVSLIPEGLPALITVALALGVQRMARRNAIIRRLPAVETLGSVSRICSDKTGTLTLMEMMVVSAVTAEASYAISGNGYAPEGDITEHDTPAGKSSMLELLARNALLCNDAELFPHEDTWKVEGDPTEAALYPFAAKAGLDKAAERIAWSRMNAIPFESDHKFMATVNSSPLGGNVLFVKGAPEVVLQHCTLQQLADGTSTPLNTAHFVQAAEAMAARGERVLALAWQKSSHLGTEPLTPAVLPENLVFIGLLGLLDPPRPEAITAVQQCHTGGIRVTMITGDHPVTAAAIAHMLGIGDGKTTLTGADIEAMDDAALCEAVQHVDVFARTSPAHKLRLVKAVQAQGQVCAMTGDGVNDAPALKQADIGIAMGIKGTEVTREAAAMVLADDNFASIGTAVQEGRTVYNNIEKAILFLFPTNLALGLVLAVAIFLGISLPLTTPQVLWVNMVTSVALGLVICFEPHEKDVMQRPPRAVNRPILTIFGIWRVLFVSTSLVAFTLLAFYVAHLLGASESMARTVAVNAITIGQCFYLLNSRYMVESSLSWQAHRGNLFLPLGIGAVCLLQLLFTYVAPFQALFGTEAMPPMAWGLLLLGGATFFGLMELEKWYIRSHPKLARKVRNAEAGK